MPFPSLSRLLLVVTTLLMASCIDGREEFWLRKDGSVKAELNYRIPEAATRALGGRKQLLSMLTESLAHRGDASTFETSVTHEEGRTRVRIRAEFASLRDMRNFASSSNAVASLPAAARHMAGSIETGMAGPSLAVKRVIFPGQAMPGMSLLPASELRDHRLTYIVHLPVAPGSSNATDTWNDGRTLEWDIPLDQAVKSPIVIEFASPASLTWLLLAILAFTVTCMMAGCALLLRMWRDSGRS